MPEATLQKIANPAPLGLAGFGLTTVLLSCINAGLLQHDSVAFVVPLAFAYGGVAQIIAGILEFKNGNTFGMVAFTSYGLFWWWWALLNYGLGSGVLKPPTGTAGAAVSLLMWGIFTFLLWIITFRTSKAVWSIFLLLWITFFLLAGNDYGIGGGTLGMLGGWFGIATGADALLVAFIETLNATAGKTVIGLGDPFIKS